MYRELLDFLRNEDCFIEAEAKPSRMRNFINEYNQTYNENLTLQDYGLIVLQEDANKWGLELRLYVSNRPPANVYQLGFKHNNTYRDNFSFRLNDKNVVRFLFEQGYRIGFN